MKNNCYGNKEIEYLWEYSGIEYEDRSPYMYHKSINMTLKEVKIILTF